MTLPAFNAAYLKSLGSDYEGIALGHIFYKPGQEAALPGGDVEVGYTLLPGLNMYVGGYYYKRSNYPTVAGPMARFRYTVLQRRVHVTLESRLSYDSPRGTVFYVGGRLSIPLFDASRRVPFEFERHMTDTPLRDVDIIMQPNKHFMRLNHTDGDPVIVGNVETAAKLADALDVDGGSPIDVIAVGRHLTWVRISLTMSTSPMGALVLCALMLVIQAL